ncbi:hypothetical protein D3C73_904320 [compost metagenome]
MGVAVAIANLIEILSRTEEMDEAFELDNCAREFVDGAACARYLVECEAGFSLEQQPKDRCGFPVLSPSDLGGDDIFVLSVLGQSKRSADHVETVVFIGKCLGRADDKGSDFERSRQFVDRALYAGLNYGSQTERQDLDQSSKEFAAFGRSIGAGIKGDFPARKCVLGDLGVAVDIRATRDDQPDVTAPVLLHLLQRLGPALRIVRQRDGAPGVIQIDDHGRFSNGIVQRARSVG